MAVSIYNNFEDTTNFSDTTSRMSLQAGTPLTVTVPGAATNQLQAIFSFTSDSSVFVGYNKTATIVAPGDVTNDQFIEHRPIKRFVKGGDVLSFATPDAIAYIGVSFRALP